MAHKHAKSMMEYAQDALETDKPWRLWEFRKEGEHWLPMLSNPNWSCDLEFRRKPNQDQLDIEAFNKWYRNKDYKGFHSDAWAAALSWERSKK